MDLSLQERNLKIIDSCMKSQSKNPISLFIEIASQPYIRIHGPEHHVLDGACLLTAYKNAGGQIDFEKGLSKIIEEGEKMPGATCASWGVCGAVTSVGATLAMIDSVSPLSEGELWGKHIRLSAKILNHMGTIGGPRCCKRDAFVSLWNGGKFLAKEKGIAIELEPIHCPFSEKNENCLKEACPFFPKQVKANPSGLSTISENKKMS